MSLGVELTARGGREPTEVIGLSLEAIRYMEVEGESVRSARLADWLGVSRPTVTVALRRMARDGMVRMNGRKEGEITRAGKRLAESSGKRPPSMERWLTDVLGLDWVTADAEAARLEHAVSGVVEERLYEALGRPGTCPHGNPIPGHSKAALKERRLASLDEGSRAAISRVSEVAEREAPLLLAYLGDRGLIPGQKVDVVEVDGVGRTIRIRAGKREVTLSHDTAAKLWVTPA